MDIQLLIAVVLALASAVFLGYRTFRSFASKEGSPGGCDGCGVTSCAIRTRPPAERDSCAAGGKPTSSCT